MIKIEYKGDAYHYSTGEQNYDITTIVQLEEDISADDAIIAFLRLLNIATYRVSIETLERIVRFLEDEGYEKGELIR